MAHIEIECSAQHVDKRNSTVSEEMQAAFDFSNVVLFLVSVAGEELSAALLSREGRLLKVK